jgi:hypothetical protein
MAESWRSATFRAEDAPEAESDGDTQADHKTWMLRTARRPGALKETYWLALRAPPAAGSGRTIGGRRGEQSRRPEPQCSLAVGLATASTKIWTARLA